LFFGKENKRLSTKLRMDVIRRFQLNFTMALANGEHMQNFTFFMVPISCESSRNVYYMV
jgi:hypothetical protein